jgi:CHAT domain-containing protein
LIAAVAVVTACTREGAALRKPAAHQRAVPDPAALARALSVPPESLFASGDVRYRAGEFDSARTIWRAEEIRTEAGHDSIGLSRVRTWLGLAAWHLGDYGEARRLGESALALKHHLGLSRELSRSYNALGLLAWDEGRLLAARALYDTAISTAQYAGDSVGAARVIGNLALVQVELGDFGGARTGLVAKRVFSHALGDVREEATALNNLGMLDVRVGNPIAAFGPLREALALFQKIDDQTRTQNTYGQLATAYAAIGETAQALAAADTGLALARQLGMQQEVASDLEVLADLHVRAGDPQEALRLLGAADSLDAALGLTVERGTDLRRSAEILLSLGLRNEAHSRIDQAIQVHRLGKARPEEMSDHLFLAALLADSAYAAAQGELDAAHRLAVSLNTRSTAYDVALTTARIAAARGEHRTVLGALAQLPASADSAGDWEVPYLRAGALLGTDQRAAAAEAARSAMNAIERGRSRAGPGVLSATLLASHADVFARYVEILITLGDTTAAFRVAASLPGRALLDRVTTGSAESADPRLAALSRAELLARRATTLSNTIDRSAAAGSDDARALQQQLQSVRDSYRASVDGLNSVPETALLGAGRIDVPTLSRALGPNEGLLVLLPGPDTLREFVLHGTRLQYIATRLEHQALADAVRLSRDLLDRGDSSARVRAVLGALHDMVIEPLLRDGALAGLQQLTIVPAGPLSVAPFAALYNSASKRYLVEDFAVLMLPSAGALPLLRARRQAPGAPTVTVFAPFADELPGTANEARAVVRGSPGAQLFERSAATKSRVREALAGTGLIHIASHSDFNPSNPMFSTISLFAPKHGASDDNGRLEVGEILRMSSAATLVFLSGCETARGPAGMDALAGVDHASLAQALLFAGARNVVATLWRIRDDPAARLAAQFYRHLRLTSPVQALALAQRDLIGRHDGSYDWAAYEILGAGATGGPGAHVVSRLP